MLQSDQVKMSEAASAFGTKLTFDTPNVGTSRMMLRTAKRSCADLRGWQRNVARSLHFSGAIAWPFVARATLCVAGC